MSNPGRPFLSSKATTVYLANVVLVRDGGAGNATAPLLSIDGGSSALVNTAIADHVGPMAAVHARGASLLLQGMPLAHGSISVDRGRAHMTVDP